MSGSEGSGVSPPSSADSDQELLPPLSTDSSIDRVMGQPVTRPGLGMKLPPLSTDSSIDRVMGQPVTRPGLGMKLPPLPPSPPVRISKTSATTGNSSHLRRTLSENLITRDKQDSEEVAELI
ncbi:hypothetical protein QE152_g25148 [Popillia japonica]|uniref:Uncharacterized protein n=1 Tax=Popillia japonica TaxID=7064 RepID=A0AAW1K2V0_POPJA